MSRPSSRDAILERAVQLASVRGLEGLSIGGLAAATGKSKGGICAHFPSKLDLQLAVVKEAAAKFRRAVVDPALEEAAGLPRLTALVDGWFSYIEAEVFEGGCFFSNAALELDGLDQPEVLAAVRKLYRSYLRLVEQCVAAAVERGELLAEPDPKGFVRLLHGLEAGALIGHALGEEGAYAEARKAAEGLLARHRAP